MVGWILKKILGSKNQRELRRLAPIVRRVNELDEQFKSLSDDELRAKTAAWKEEFSKIPELEDQWKKLNEILPEAFAVVKNAARRLKERQHSFTVRSADGLGHGALRCAAARRSRFAPGPDRGNGDWRRQNFGRDAAALLKCSHRARRAPGDGERLSGATRCGMDGATLRFPRAHRWLHRTRSGARCSPRTIRDGHHLRNEQRVRFRLSARQRHGHYARTTGPARLSLCHCR